MSTWCYVVIEFLVIDLIFILLVRKYLKILSLEKLLDKKYRKKYNHISKKSRMTSKAISFKHILNRLENDRLSFNKEKDFRMYIFFQYTLPFILFILIVLKLGKDSFPFMLIPVLYYLSNRSRFKKNIAKRNLSFQKNTYKIYKFIYNQVSSGVRPHDCVMGLYDVIEEKCFKRALINMSAVYSQTSNIDLSLKSITDIYPGIDAIMLCGAIKQGVQIGSNMETVERQEKLAFNKYFMYIKNETEKIKFKGFLSISLFAFIIILLISVPLLYEMKEATTKIFIN